MKTIRKMLIGKIRIWLVMKGITVKKASTGAIISGFDNLKPEQTAMVQALNSRSAGGFLKNLKQVLLEGFTWFMAKFYAGYGHKSIADCGSSTIAADNISMLAAKGLQDWQLYNGQETSTRYIDVTGLGFVDPIGSPLSQEIMKCWFSFYKDSLRPTIEHLKKVRPKRKGEDQSKWETMLEKRAYDILGSFLPAGACTNASAHMTLRQWDDKLSWMLHNPLPEIAEIGNTIFAVMQDKYPSTFLKKKVRGESEAYRAQFMKESYYTPISDNEKSATLLLRSNQYLMLKQNFYHDSLLEKRYRKTIVSRPPKTELPRIVNQCASYRLEFLIDYRSHRDLQRQRSATQEVPLLTTWLGFEQWYLDQLPEDVRVLAEKLIDSLVTEIIGMTEDPLIRQYYIPMGFRIFDAFTISLADLVYIIELRTPPTVHPTARRIARLAHQDLAETLPGWFKIYADESDDDLDIRRADHDILVDGKSFSKM